MSTYSIFIFTKIVHIYMSKIKLYSYLIINFDTFTTSLCMAPRVQVISVTSLSPSVSWLTQDTSLGLTYSMAYTW